MQVVVIFSLMIVYQTSNAFPDGFGENVYLNVGLVFHQFCF